MPTVSVPGAYRGATRGESEVEVEASSLRGCIEAVEAAYPGFQELVFDGQGALHRFVKLFVNEEEIAPAELDRAVGEGDRVDVLAAIAGG
ncbi:MAG: MoaD/ThiS family protein [Myxococcota bacterium]|jgi:molybdopterin converting factor small subunit